MCVRSFDSLFPLEQDEPCTGKHDQHAAKEIEQVGAGAAGRRKFDAGIVPDCECSRSISCLRVRHILC